MTSKPCIMILGANVLQLPLIKSAVRNGYEVALVAPNLEEPGFRYASYAVEADVKDAERILDYARKYNISGIITDQTDLPVRSVAYVAERLGLPGIGYECACLFTDKYLMREKCRSLGIPVLKYAVTACLAEAVRFFKESDGSVILKPVDNQGSKGVLKADSVEELALKYPLSLSYSRSGKVLVEQFVRGREFVVEGIAYEGRFRNLIIGDTSYFNIPDVFSATERIFPSEASSELQERVLETNRKIIEGFGLRQGITHSEFIVCNDEIYLIETAARGGGVFISSDIIPCLTGLDTQKFLLDIATGRPADISRLTDTGRCCGYVAFFLPAGRISSVEGVAQASAMSCIHSNNLDTLYVGRKTEVFGDKTGRYFMVVSADSPKELRDNINIIRDTIRVEVQTGAGIEYPIWE